MGRRWITAAEVISHHACTLKGLVVTPSVADAECIVYDGEGDTDPVILSLFLATRNSHHYRFPEGLPLNRGLYVGTFTNVTGVLVIWEPKG